MSCQVEPPKGATERSDALGAQNSLGDFYEHLLTMELQPVSTVRIPDRAAVWVGSAASCLLAASQAVAHAKLEAATPAHTRYARTFGVRSMMLLARVWEAE